MSKSSMGERRSQQLGMLCAILEWLRQQPVGPNGPFSGFRNLDIDWQEGASHVAWTGQLDNGEPFILLFEAYAPAKEFRFHVFAGNEAKAGARIEFKGTITSNFERVTLPSGNFWLRFIPAPLPS